MPDVTLRSFSESDWQGLAGAEAFADGRPPLIGETEFNQVVASATGLEVFFAGTSEVWCLHFPVEYVRSETARDLARFVLQHAVSASLSPYFLRTLGFAKIQD